MGTKKRVNYYISRIRVVCEEASRWYQPGRHDRCLRWVWRHHILPIWPMGYKTFLSYWRKRDLPDPEMDRNTNGAIGSLFDVED